MSGGGVEAHESHSEGISVNRPPAPLPRKGCIHARTLAKYRLAVCHDARMQKWQTPTGRAESCFLVCWAA
jgi:hypothetical protein